jgi:hypothetical protein
MATANKKVETKTIMVPTIVEDVKVELKLSMKEAQFLLFLNGFCGGDPNFSPRVFSNNIRDALIKAGVTLPKEYNQFCLYGKPGILFKSTKDYAYEGLLDETLGDPETCTDLY